VTVDAHRCYTPPEAHEATRLPRDLIYASLRDGSLRAVRRGRVYLIGGAALIRFIERLGEEEKA
jgi:excisionase family DNA binding protein